MSDYAWQPVPEQTRIACECGECDRTIEAGDGYIELYDDDGTEMSAHLPVGYALCRRVPASAGVPVGVREAWRALKIRMQLRWADYDDEVTIDIIDTWLDRITTAEQYAQPQTGQK